MSGVLIVPGLHDSGADHWQTHWQQRLPIAHRIRLRQWREPDLQQWVDAIVGAVNVHRPHYIVAHSFGCLATAYAADAVADRIRGVMLVAPADPEKFGIAELLPHNSLPMRGLVVGSLTDPWLSWSKAQQWAQRWELPIYCAGAAGHINAESGHGAWSEGWELLQRLRQHETATLRPPREPAAPRWAAVY